MGRPGDSLGRPGDSLGRPGDSLGRPGDKTELALHVHVLGSFLSSWSFLCRIMS